MKAKLLFNIFIRKNNIYILTLYSHAITLSKSVSAENNCWSYFKSTNGENEMFKDWLMLLKKLSENHYSTEDFICPECGQKSVEYTYVGDLTTRIGYLPIWCKHCNKGIQISRVKIPEEVNMIDFNDLDSIKRKISNFKQVLSNH